MSLSSIENPGLHITIGVQPSGNLSLEQELRLSKAALLYGDYVKLYSPTYSMLSMMMKLGDFAPSPILQMEFLRKTTPFLASKKDAKLNNNGLKRAKKLFRAKYLSKKDRDLLASFLAVIEQHWKDVKRKAIEIASTSGFFEMERAVQSGLLELHTFAGTDNDEAVLDFLTDCVAGASGSPLVTSRRPEMSRRNNEMVQEYVQKVSSAVSDGTTYPLFDTATCELIREEIGEKKIVASESAIERGKHSGLAGHLLDRLPLFDQASMSETLDIREELGDPLIRFRAAMVQFSEEIKHASWDQDFPSDAERVFYQHVGPAILDIEEAVKSNRYLAILLDGLIEKPSGLPSGSIFSLVLSHFSDLPDGLALTLGLGASAAGTAYKAYKEWEEKNQDIKQNQMFFYYQAKRRLAK